MAKYSPYHIQQARSQYVSWRTVKPGLNRIMLENSAYIKKGSIVTVYQTANTLAMDLDDSLMICDYLLFTYETARLKSRFYVNALIDANYYLNSFNYSINYTSLKNGKYETNSLSAGIGSRTINRVYNVTDCKFLYFN